MVSVQMKGMFMKILMSNQPGSGMSPQKSMNWLRGIAQSMPVKAPDVQKAGEQAPFIMRPTLTPNDIGKLFLWTYDAKWAKELPYWDKYPMAFIVDVQPEYFYGINLHYLYPKRRAQLMDALMEIANNDRYDKKTKLMISYKLLKGASQLKYFAPCFKKYLKSQIRSRFLYVNPNSWNFALFLPLQEFQKASDTKVWQDSEEIIRKQRKP